MTPKTTVTTIEVLLLMTDTQKKDKSWEDWKEDNLIVNYYQ